MHALLIGWLAIPALAAPTLQVDRTSIVMIQQDSTGVVWAAGSSDLYRWNANAWQHVMGEGIPAPSPVVSMTRGVAGEEIHNASPVISMTRGLDGAVYCLWRSHSEVHTLTRHQGDSTREFAQFTGPLANFARLFVDPTGNLWITEQGRHIYRVTSQGKAEAIYTIPGDQFIVQGREGNNLPRCNPISAVADGRGQVWFWSNMLEICPNQTSLDGVLIFNGEKFEHHPQIAGTRQKKLSIIAPDDADHLWLAATEDQLYKVDVNTLAAVPAPAPDSESFRYVQQIFPAHQDTYFVSGAPWQIAPERSANGRFGAVWRLRDGKWKRVINGLDMLAVFFPSSFRPWLETPNGFWLGAYTSGPWFIPAGGKDEPALIDWHYGFPLDGSNGLVQLPGGRLLIVASNWGSVAVKPADMLGAFQSPPEVRTLNPLRPFIQDPRGHMVGLISTGDTALSDWDGQTWKDHPFPAGFDPTHIGSFAEDSLQRIWLLPDLMGKWVAIFDPQREIFENYAGYGPAFEAQLPHRDNFHLRGELAKVPSFTADGRIIFRDDWARVRYFDGQKWLRWKCQEIDPSTSFACDGPAFFDRAGNAAVNIHGRTWEFTGKAGWRTIGFDPGLGTDSERQAVHRPAAPSGCDFSSPDSIAQDRLGTYWMTFHGQLYRAIAGLCVPQFSAEEHQPFIDSRTVKNAIIDPRGNAFLESYFYVGGVVGEYVIVNARQPLPQTALRAFVDASGKVTLRFKAKVKGPAGYTWRMDGGPWSAPTKSRETTLEDLPNGKHRIEAATLDRHLQIDLTPAEATVDVHVDTGKQIGELIQDLAASDYDVREKAVAKLVLQSAAALPLLQSAREKAGPDQRWWIDVAIAQIEESLAKKRQP